MRAEVPAAMGPTRPPASERAKWPGARELARAFLVGSIGVLVASAIHAFFHYVLFIEQMLRFLM